MEILKSGRLRNRVSGAEEDYYILKLCMTHFDILMNLQKTVMESMNRKELYAGLTAEEVKNMLCDDGGVIIGAFVNEKLIAFYGVYFPGGNKDNLGKDLGVAGDDLFSVMHLEGAGVHPHYQGNSLQKTMNVVCFNEALKLGQFRYICATVSPYNYPSLDHLLVAGLYIRNLKTKYGGMLRYICCMDMKDQRQIISDSVIDVSSSDYAMQSKLLSDGFVGYKLVKSNNACYIRFSKK
jgi:hypothetical protein